ncbi:two pore domain potassium channel family protein [Candidatus Micrarchaeota archaeon]|nr:two pore domain potassium channel family protein [Candidatus Micrarchaeota archaeon]
MDPEVRSLIIPIITLLIIYAISILFFHYVEGWSFLDAAYYTTVTIATVGYGDFTPKTSIGKIGAMILIFTGISVALYVITHLGALRARTIDPHLQQRLKILRSLTELQTSDTSKSDLKDIKKKMKDHDSK